nr:hypothetical protein [Verrucomicrobium spinosum]
MAQRKGLSATAGERLFHQIKASRKAVAANLQITWMRQMLRSVSPGWIMFFLRRVMGGICRAAASSSMAHSTA